VGAGADREAARAPVVLEAKGFRLAVVAVTDHPQEYAAGTDRAGVAFADLGSGGLPRSLTQAIGGLEADTRSSAAPCRHSVTFTASAMCSIWLGVSVRDGRCSVNRRRQQKLVDDRRQKLVVAAIAAEPWCSYCGATENLSLLRGPRRWSGLRLADADFCRRRQLKQGRTVVV
jgi:hypothetical protein